MTKIFVIDDSVGACVAVERMLSPQGFDVVWENDAVTALRTVERHAPDLIVCDVILPEIDGFELCQSLRSNPLLDRVPVVLISGEVGEATRARAEESGAATILEKPFEAPALVEVVRETLDQAESLPRETDDDPMAAALRQRLSSELDGLSVLAGRYACIADGDGRVVAAATSVPATLGPNAQKGLQVACRLAKEARRAADRADGPIRLTLEADDRIRIVEGVESDLFLVVELSDVSSLGKARFLLRRLRARLSSMLRVA